MDLVTPEQMRQMDRRTIDDVGLPGIVTMERAALGAVQALHNVLLGGRTGRVGIVCGAGNNGGDGVAMARLLAADDRCEPIIVLMSDPDSMSGDAARQIQIATGLALPLVELGDCPPDDVGGRLAEVGECIGWCDALLGTGLDRDVEGRYAAAIEFLNRQSCVLAVDIPSGVHGTTGQVMGRAVAADATATFGRAKLGQVLYPGRSLCGDLRVVDIGIPDSVVAEVGGEAELTDQAWSRGRMGPRPDDYHKGDSGKVLVLAGSHQKTGAALLAARGALNAGAGLLTVGTHREVVARVAPTVNEAMAAELVSDAPDDNCEERLRQRLERVDAVGIGPGLGTSDGASQALDAVLDSTDVQAAVFDADALNLLANRADFSALEAFAGRATAVLTPHPGEMARLRGSNIAEVIDAPVAVARQLADAAGAFVVLKMAATVVAAPDGSIAINDSGNSGMAAGGVGDVLTGVITARLAEATEPVFDAIRLAVYAHGAAGDAAAQSRGRRGMSAGDLAEHLPSVWKRLEQ